MSMGEVVREGKEETISHSFEQISSFTFERRQILAHFKTLAILPNSQTLPCYFFYKWEQESTILLDLCMLFRGLCRPTWDKVLGQSVWAKWAPGSQTAFSPTGHTCEFCLIFLSLCLDPTVIGATKVHRWQRTCPHSGERRQICRGQEAFFPKGREPIRVLRGSSSGQSLRPVSAASL